MGISSKYIEKFFISYPLMDSASVTKYLENDGISFEEVAEKPNRIEFWDRLQRAASYLWKPLNLYSQMIGKGVHTFLSDSFLTMEKMGSSLRGNHNHRRKKIYST